MKKNIILCLIVLFSIVPIMAHPISVHDGANNTSEQTSKIRAQKVAEFEKKLGLTEAQKTKTKELRKSGHEKMRPIMELIKVQEMEKQVIRYSQLSPQAQQEQISKIDIEINRLKKQASEIKKQNMKDFEGILTPEQKNTLKAMKKEGRAKYKATHPKNMFPPFPCNFKPST